MNAYELADKLKLFWHTENDNLFEDTATMLRHQADYIKHLEEGLESSIAMNKAQVERLADLERKHKEEFDYAEKLLKEQQK
jgi:hypothetical protein